MNNKIFQMVLTLIICLFAQTSCSGQQTNQKTGYTMNELTKKLINTERGIWALKGLNNELYYIYSLQFSKNEKIVFSYHTCEKEYGMCYTINIRRFGTFKIDNNILTINFTSVIGSRYNKPKFSDEPLSENISIKMEIEIVESKEIVKEHIGKLAYIENPSYTPKDVEITEYKLILKRICGENIFENHNEDARIELIAERPIID